MSTRRDVVAGAILSLLGTRSSVAQTRNGNTLPLPDSKLFESGDLIWPKRPGAYVPYNATLQRGDPEDEERRWTAERDQFIVGGPPAFFGVSDKKVMQNLSFREFYARYAGDQVSDQPGVYRSGGGVYVGHVAIVEIDHLGNQWVIEALLERGVTRAPYRAWIAARPQEIIWHGRVRELSADARANIALEAKRYEGRPYDFWNFDLEDDNAFYCSKLVWLSIFRSLGFAIDGNPNTKRTFWFSPKQLLYLKTIARLHDPGPYAYK